MGFLGDLRSRRSDRGSQFEAAVADAAQEAAEVAQSANVLCETVRFLVASQLGSDAQSEGAHAETVVSVDGLAEAAAELHERAEELSRQLMEDPLPAPRLRLGGRPPVRRFSPPPALAGDLGETPVDGPVSEGLRLLIVKMLADGWSEEEAAYYLSTELDISDAHRVVAEALDAPAAESS